MQNGTSDDTNQQHSLVNTLNGPLLSNSTSITTSTIKTELPTMEGLDVRTNSIASSSSSLLTVQPGVINTSLHSSQVMTSNTSSTTTGSVLPSSLTNGSPAGSTENCVTSPTPTPSIQSLSTSISQPLTINPCNLSPKPSLLSPLLSPSVSIALASPSSSKSPLTSVGPSNHQVPKLSLLFDGNELPAPPKPPHPPLPTDKLSPPTPSICVSIKQSIKSL